GRDDGRESARGRASVLARQCYFRLMIAFNLGLGYVRARADDEAAPWLWTGLETARALVLVMPGDRQLWYMRGMCCANLIEAAQKRRRATPFPLHHEALACLEKALAMKPDEH